MRITAFLLFLIPAFVQAQIGGRHVYDFLDLTPQARVAAIGGKNVSTQDYDQNFGYQNPALVNDSMHNRLAFSFVDYLGGITYGYASYAYSIENVADFHSGFQFVNYGKMIEADAYGNQTGTFSASDLAWVIGASRKVYDFRIGANFKFINSNIAGYNSFSAGALDIGGSYQSRDRSFTAGMVFKNIGVQFSKYSSQTERAPLPFEVQTGLSYKFEHMPLRISVTGINLESPRMIYKDPNPKIEYDLAGNEIKIKSQVADNIFRHIVFGGEFLLSRNFNLRMGYNHQRRQELKSESKAGMSGFSFGFGIKIKGFQFDYAYSNYHAIGGTNSFTLSTPLDRFSKKDEKLNSL